MADSDKIHIAVFSGGRGTAGITSSLLKHSQIHLTLIVNAYDDGLSTGALRRFIPGMLGPSDVRKNISRLIETYTPSGKALEFLLEYRFPKSITDAQALDCLRTLGELATTGLCDDVHKSFIELPLKIAKVLQKYIDAFLQYYQKNIQSPHVISFQDCSLGNIFFAGCYLQESQDFNRAIQSFSDLCEIRGTVINVTQGEGYVLVGLKEDGEYLADEAAIVSKQSSTNISDIFLLPDYLQSAELAELSALDFAGKKAYLSARHKTPKISTEAQSSLSSADIIIYGPGTQHSSLFPSYFTDQVAEAIAANKSAQKIFISNIFKDHEIQGENVGSLSRKLIYYLTRKNSVSIPWNQLANTFFIQFSDVEQTTNDNVDYVMFDQETFPFDPENVHLANWESTPGAHSGGRVLEELIALVNSKLNRKVKTFHHKVSIVVPGLNEQKTVQKVLHDLVLLNLQPLGIAKEVIFVDGGSTDKTYELASQVTDAKAYQLGPNEKKGRGACLRFGVQKASGNIILFFPSDNEYQVTDIPSLLMNVIQNDAQVVFGSRTIKCVNVDTRIKEIYRGNWLGYFTSKYGGILISVLSLLLHNRFVTDPFTSVKAFDARLLRSLGLSANGVDLEAEIIGMLSKHEVFILEIPVDYKPRTKLEGKKTTIWDGLQTIWMLLKLRF